MGFTLSNFAGLPGVPDKEDAFEDTLTGAGLLVASIEPVDGLDHRRRVSEALLGVVAVLSSLHPLATMALARFYFQERLRRLQQVGVALCIAGVVAVAT